MCPVSGSQCRYSLRCEICLSFYFHWFRFHLETISLCVINCPQASKALTLIILTTMHTNDLSQKINNVYVGMPKAKVKED